MVIRFNKILYLSVTLVLFGLAFIYFAVRIVLNSLPPDYAEYKSEKVRQETTIHRDDYGIPHIVSSSERDLYFALGYAQAEDRMWQLDYYRRLAKGELSEIFGEKEVAYDKFMRAFDLKNLSKKVLKNAGAETRIILTSFADGVNFYIQQHLKKLPVEFSTLDYVPDKWKPEDCIAIFKLFALSNSPGMTNDIIMGEIADKFGIRRANELIGQYPLDAPLVYEQNTYKKPVDTAIADTSAPVPMNAPQVKAPQAKIPEAKTAPIKPKTAQLSDEFYDAYARSLAYISAGSGSTGSNAWAVISERRGKKYSVIANDPHLKLSNPTQFYQAKLTCDNYNLTGLVVAGTPIMLIGRNDNIAWGVANSMADDFDYFIETIDRKKPDFYFDTDSTLQRFKYVLDTIKVKNQPYITYYKRKTKHSFVLSDYHADNKLVHKDKPRTNPYSKNYYSKHCLTYNWSGDRNYDDFEHLYRMVKSRNWEQFHRNARKVHSPSLNFVYSDEKGNIGMLTSGYIPIRNVGVSSVLPLHRNRTNSWLGFLSEGELPFYYNPNKRYIFATNNKLFMNRYASFSNYWDSPSRAIRLDTLLKQAFRYSYRDAQIAQNDLYSPLAEKIMKMLMPLLQKQYSSMRVTEKRAIERLKKWDYRMMPTFPSSMIYNEVYKNLLRNIFLDELGEKYFAKYMLLRNYAGNKLIEVLDNPEDSYIKNLIKNHRNAKIYDINSLLVESFRQSVDSLTSRFGTNEVSEWIYGKEHTLQIKHKFSEDIFLRPSFEMEKFELGGNGSTLNNYDYDYNSPYEVIIASACKFVSVMSDKYVYTSIPGGSSGQNYSNNYSDQLQLWIFGGYVKLNTSRKVDENFRLAVKITP